MLGSAEIVPTLPVVDLARARQFYEHVLGLAPAGPETADGILLRAGRGTSVFLFPRAPTRADHTVATFFVADLDSAVAALRARGVVFEDYDLPGLKTVGGIAELVSERAAWFRDPEGNVLAVSQLR